MQKKGALICTALCSCMPVRLRPVSGVLACKSASLYAVCLRLCTFPCTRQQRHAACPSGQCIHPVAAVPVTAAVRLCRIVSPQDALLPSIALLWNGSSVVVLDDHPADRALAVALQARPPYPRVVFESWDATDSAFPGLCRTNQYIWHCSRDPYEPSAAANETLQETRQLPNGCTEVVTWRSRGPGYDMQAYSTMWSDQHSSADVVAVMDTDSVLLLPPYQVRVHALSTHCPQSSAIPGRGPL